MAKVALCHFEHDGESYDWGDEVPEAVASEFPNAVGNKPLEEKEILKLNKEDLQKYILSLHQNSDVQAAIMRPSNPEGSDEDNA